MKFVAKWKKKNNLEKMEPVLLEVAND